MIQEPASQRTRLRILHCSQLPNCHRYVDIRHATVNSQIPVALSCKSPTFFSFGNLTHGCRCCRSAGIAPCSSLHTRPSSSAIDSLLTHSRTNLSRCQQGAHPCTGGACAAKRCATTQHTASFRGRRSSEIGIYLAPHWLSSSVAAK